MPYRFTVLYICLIVLVNWGFTVVPLVDLSGGKNWPPMSLVVGLIFVARDYAQREIGHRIIIAMLIAASLSYVMASPFVAVASLGRKTSLIIIKTLEHCGIASSAISQISQTPSI